MKTFLLRLWAWAGRVLVAVAIVAAVVLLAVAAVLTSPLLAVAVVIGWRHFRL